MPEGTPTHQDTQSHAEATDGATVAQDAETPTEAQQSHHSHAERQRMPTAARAEQGRTQSRSNAGRVGYTYINIVWQQSHRAGISVFSMV